MAHPGGRPTDYKPELCKKVKDMMRQGMCIEEVCYELDIAKGTLYNWQKEHKEFLDAVEHGKDLCYAWHVKQGREHLENRQYNDRMYNLRMQNMFGWNKKVEQNITVSTHEDRIKELK